MKRVRSVLYLRVIIYLLGVVMLSYPLGVAQQRDLAKAEQRQSLDISIVPPYNDQPGIRGILAVRVGELFSHADMVKAGKRINEWLGKNLKETAGFSLPIKVQDIDQVTFRLFIELNADGPNTVKFNIYPSSIRMLKPTNWAEIIKAIPDSKIMTRDGMTTFKVQVQLGKIFPEELHEFIRIMGGDRLLEDRIAIIEGRMVDDRTLVLNMDKEESPQAKAKTSLAWAPEWKDVDDGLLAFVLHNQKQPKSDKGVEPQSKKDSEGQSETAKLVWQLLPRITRVVVGLDTRERFRLKACFVCHTAKEAEEVAMAWNTCLKAIGKATASQKPNKEFWGKVAASATVKCTGDQVKIAAETPNP